MNKIGILVLFALASTSIGCAAGAESEETAQTDEALSSTYRITCESTDHHYNSCGAPGDRIQSARVVRRLSNAPCNEGQSWGYAENYLWVNYGCRAEFEVRVQLTESNRRIRITSATYGKNIGAPRGNATSFIARECDRRAACDYQISAREIGDPGWGRAKDFEVEYTCGNGTRARRGYVTPEANGRTISLSCDSNPPTPPADCGELLSGESVYPGQGIDSCDGRTSFVHQADGNIVLTHDGRTITSSYVTDRRTQVLTMQDDGNLVQYARDGHVIWSSNTAGHYGATLRVQDDCNVVIYDRGGRAIWHTNTQGCYLH